MVYWGLNILILKTTKPGNHVDDIALPVYKNDNCLCIINTFSEYVNRTKELRQRGCKRLLISTIKPYWPVTINTISRWIKSVLKQSGVDTDKFKAHSVRGNQLQQLRQLMYLYWQSWNPRGGNGNRLFESFIINLSLGNRKCKYPR